MWVQSLHLGDPLEEDMATHSSTLAWRIFMDREAWRAIVYGITNSQTQLKGPSMHTHKKIRASDKKLVFQNGSKLAQVKGRSLPLFPHQLFRSCVWGSLERVDWDSKVPINVELGKTAPSFVFVLSFYWSLVDLQRCVCFRCTTKWISFTCTYNQCPFHPPPICRPLQNIE